jgi:ADP-ribose pyrophosphatase
MMPNDDTQSHPPHETATGSHRAFDGKMLHVRVDDVRLPSGRESVREVVEHPGSAIIVPITASGEVLMIEQYRHVIGKRLLELPAGLVDPGEDALMAAGRELIEETGFSSDEITPVASLYASPGYTEERATLYLARNCHPVTDHRPDPDEPLTVVPIPLAGIPDLLVPGANRVENAAAVIGLLWLLRRDLPSLG